jgi:putative chitinase
MRLATAFHETASTMQPVKEYGGNSYFTRMYDITGARAQKALAMGNTCAGDGPKYCGRGYVQLTWKTNYSKAGEKCGVDLVTYPDKAMDPAIAAKILRHGMEGRLVHREEVQRLSAGVGAGHERPIRNGPLHH